MGKLLLDPLPPTHDLPNSPATSPTGSEPSSVAQPNLPAQTLDASKPSNSDVTHGLAKVEPVATKSATTDAPVVADRGSSPHPGPPRALGVILYLSVGFGLIMLLGWSAQNGAQRIRSFLASAAANPGRRSSRQRGNSSQLATSPQQAEAENILERLASGDSAAADQVLAESDDWIGKTYRTANANQLVNMTLNQHDLHLRGAALQATLALDGISRDADGLNRLELAVANAGTRAWALWMLGALANRGVQQERIVNILQGYLSDADPRTRSGAVDGLGIVATDATISMLLDRFRNDPSPVVEESAARNLAEAGMYTHEQRMVAAADFIEWMSDERISPQQKSWTVHLLRDVSGQNFGMDSKAWREWYSGAH